MDYPLQVQSNSGAKRFGSFRTWACEMAVQEADDLAELTGKPHRVMDTRFGKLVYDSVNGHSNYVPQESNTLLA